MSRFQSETKFIIVPWKVSQLCQKFSAVWSARQLSQASKQPLYSIPSLFPTKLKSNQSHCNLKKKTVNHPRHGNCHYRKLLQAPAKKAKKPPVFELLNLKKLLWRKLFGTLVLPLALIHWRNRVEHLRRNESMTPTTSPSRMGIWPLQRLQVSLLWREDSHPKKV